MSASSHPTVATPFVQFQFKTIGQPPDLLKRMSAANPDSQIYEDSDSERASLSPDLATELLPPESSGNTPDLPKAPSLRERLAMANDGANETNSIKRTTPEIRSNSIFSWKPKQTNESDLSPVLQDDSVTHEADKTSKISHAASDVPLVPSVVSQQSSRILSTSGSHDAKSQNQDIPMHRSGQQSKEALHDSSHHAEASTSSIASTTSEPPLFTVFETLQTKISASVGNLRPIKIQEMVSLVQSAKDSFAEICTSANRAYSYAEKAATAVEESKAATKEYIAVVGTTQARLDEIMTAVEQIGDGDRGRQQNDSVKTLTAVPNELREWSQQMKLQYRLDQEERKAEREKYQQAAERPCHPDDANAQRTLPGTSSVSSDRISPVASTSASISDPHLLMSVEHEADAIARAWNEQRAERDRQANEEIQKCREDEEATRSALAAFRAKRIATEEKEKERLRREAQAVEVQNQVLARKREEVFRLGKASEERAMEEKEKVLQLEREDRQRQEEQRRKEASEREEAFQLQERRRKEAEKEEALQQRLAIAKEQALKAQQRLLHEQQQKVTAKDHNAPAKDADENQHSYVKSKQPRAQVENTVIPRTHDVYLPISPPSNYESLLQVELPAQHDNARSEQPRKLPFENPDKPIKIVTPASENTDSSSHLNRIAASATSSNRPLTVSSGYDGSDDQTLSRPTTSASDALINVTKALPLVASTPSELFKQSRPENVSLTVRHNGNLPVVPPQTRKENHPPPTTSLPPPIPGLPKKPIQSYGQDQSSPARTRRSQFASMSPTTRKADLQPLVGSNMNPQSSMVKVKTEPMDDNHSMKPERITPVSSKPPIPSLNDDRGRTSLGKRKAESPSVPLLSLPSPPASTTSFKQTPSPIEQNNISEKEGPRLNPSDNRRQDKRATPSLTSKAPYLAQPILNVADGPNQNILHRFDHSARPETLARHGPAFMTPTLPSQATSGSSVSGVTKNSSQYYDYNTSSRMGPDTVTPDAWIQPSASHANVQDPGLDQRQATRRQSPRPPPQPIKRHIEHRSPPRSVNNRNQQPRARPARRREHSPHRAPSPSPAYSGYASPARSRSRDSSRNNSRMATPEPPPHMSMYQMGVPFKRKRLNDQVNGPPQRRPRYDEQRPLEVGPHNPRAGAQYASTSARNGSHADWSNVANYSRSPSPEPLQPPPLYQRLDESDRHYRPKQEAYNRQPVTQSGPYRGDDYQTNHIPQNARYTTTDSRLPLLDRFTDSPSYYPHSNNHNNHVQQHSASSRGSRTRGRGGTSQPLAPRIAKGHLIDRLGDP